MNQMKKLIRLIAVIAGIFLFSQIIYAGTWQQEGNAWKYQKDNGAYAASEWVQDSGKWYYFNNQGIMLSSQWVDGLYYLGADGAMLVNTTTPDGYQVDANGKWVSAGTSAVTQTVVKETAQPKAAAAYTQQTQTSTRQAAAAANTNTQGAAYIGNANTKKFHDPGCGSVKQMSDKNKRSLGSRDEAISKGYVPCQKCNP